MSKNTISASATALPSRRLILAAAPAAAILTSTHAIAAEESPPQALQFDQAEDDRAVSLWEERSALRPLFIEASRAIRKAESRLPDWAKPGPSYLRHDGSLSGPIAGWPAIRDMQPPDQPEVFRLIRPGKNDILHWFNSGFSVDEKRRLAAIKKGRSELAMRLREQRAEERRTGYLAANLAHDAIFRRLEAIDEQIESLPNTAPNAAAGHVLNAVMLNAIVSNSVDECHGFQIALPALEFLRPHLRGLVKVHVDEWLDNRDARISSTEAYVFGDGENDLEIDQVA